MALPIIIGIIIWGSRAYKAYETYETAQAAVETARMVADIAARREEAKEVMKSIIEKFSEEIHIKSSDILNVSGGRSTISRGRKENVTYREYIDRKIPFRPAISIGCKWALASPITVPRRIRRKIPGDLVEDTIEVKLKQTTASLIFEAIDEALDWTSPLKAEPNYNRDTAEPLTGTPETRPQRISDIFPFWPRPRGSLAPDLVIVEYRQETFAVDNVFAAVEIKFPNDWVKPQQMKSYVELMDNNERKVALLRVPEDCTGYRHPQNQGQSGRRGGAGRK